MFFTRTILVAVVILTMTTVPSLSSPSKGAPERCCAPSQLIGQVVFAGKSQYTTYVDFEDKVELEDHGGNNGIEYRLYDGKKSIYYERKVNGECKIKPIKYERYWRCVPETAVHVPVTWENGIVLDGWLVNVDLKTTRLIVLKRESCLPYRIVQTRNDITHKVHFIDIVEGFDAETVFNKDVTDCVSD